MTKPYTDEEIEQMWKADMLRYKDAGLEFKRAMNWMYQLETYKEVMKLAHLSNPFVKIVRKEET